LRGVAVVLIVALDPPAGTNVGEWIASRYEALKDIVQGFKLGLPAIVKHGIDSISKCFSDYEGLLIADLKLADIGDVMAEVVKWLKNLGINGVIAHGFVGYRGGVEVLARTCREAGVKLILVVSMSHEGSAEFIDKHLDGLIELAKAVDSWGVVAPATRPNVIRYVRARLGSDMVILSPGVGAQGAEPGDALCAGADYEIVGRAITRAENLREAALNVIRQQKEKVSKCRG